MRKLKLNYNNNNEIKNILKITVDNLNLLSIAVDVLLNILEKQKIISKEEFNNNFIEAINSLNNNKLENEKIN